MPAIDRRKYMSSAQVCKLLRVTAVAAQYATSPHACAHTAWAVVDTALGTGLRPCELAALRIEDLDVTIGSLMVVRRKKRQPSPKPEPLAISPSLAQHLSDYVRRSGRLSGPLFVGQRGPMTKRGIQQAWGGAVQRAGLPAHYSIKSARHTVAVTLLRRTGSIRAVQAQLAHASPVTSANMYSVIGFEQLQAALTDLYSTEPSSHLPSHPLPDISGK